MIVQLSVRDVLIVSKHGGNQPCSCHPSWATVCHVLCAVVLRVILRGERFVGSTASHQLGLGQPGELKMCGKVKWKAASKRGCRTRADTRFEVRRRQLGKTAGKAGSGASG